MQPQIVVHVLTERLALVTTEIQAWRYCNWWLSSGRHFFYQLCSPGTVMYIQEHSWYFFYYRNQTFLMFAFACGQSICFLTFVWRLRVYYFRYTLPSRDIFVYVRHIILVWDACSLYCYLFIVFLQCTVLESNWQHKRGEAYSGTTSIYMHPAIATTMNRVMPIYFLCTRRHEVWINVWMSNNFYCFPSSLHQVYVPKRR